MTAPDFALASWRASSYSHSNGGDCVEVAVTEQPVVGIRDSKDRAAGHLTVTTPAWHALLSRIGAR